MSSLDGQVVRNFKFPQGETIAPSRTLTGRKPGGSFSLSVFNAPAPPYPSIVLRHLAHRPDMLSFFPHYALFNARRCHHVSLNYPGRHRAVPCSHMFSCVFKMKYSTVVYLPPLISPHPEGKVDENIWNYLEYDTIMPVRASLVLGVETFHLISLTARTFTRRLRFSSESMSAFRLMSDTYQFGVYRTRVL